MASLVFCLVPRKSNRKRSRSSESGPPGLFAEPELREKDENEEEHGSLKELNEQSHNKLFTTWDIDLASMETLPGGIPPLAPFWEVGGGLARPTDSDSPFGLEIYSSPFTLRIRSIFHSVVNEDHDALLRAAAKELRQFLQDCWETGHPILSNKLCSLPKNNVFVLENSWQLPWSIDSLVQSGKSLLQVWPIKASAFFETLKAMNSKMLEEMGELRPRTAWERKVVDYGSQALLSDLFGGTS